MPEMVKFPWSSVTAPKGEPMMVTEALAMGCPKSESTTCPRIPPNCCAKAGADKVRLRNVNQRALLVIGQRRQKLFLTHTANDLEIFTPRFQMDLKFMLLG
jgi:hypothetical protein